MSRKLPKLCHHKHDGRGYVTDPFTSLEVYLGVYDTPECQAAYDRWIVELIARRQQESSAPSGNRLSVAGLLSSFLDHAEGYYRKHGKITSEVRAFRDVAGELNELFGTLAADELSPGRLKAVRQRLIDRGLAREHINAQVRRVGRIWRWGVEQEVVKVEVLRTLREVAPLAEGRMGVREEEPVEPVPLEVVQRTLAVLDTQAAAMVRLQLHGSLRAEDVVVMRACDFTLTETSCLYVPWTHKTEHRGRARRLWLGPVCREVLRPLLAGSPRPDAWLFRAKGGKGHMAVQTYRRRIAAACAGHGLPHWTPLALRHTALTLVRERFGGEASRVVGGHAHLSTTEIYAARDEVLARKVAEEMG